MIYDSTCKPSALKTGESLILTDGEYSDFSIRAVTTVQKDFDIVEAGEKYLEQHPEQRDDYLTDTDGFIAWLVQEGYVKEVSYREINLGTYGRFMMREETT